MSVMVKPRPGRIAATLLALLVGVAGLAAPASATGTSVQDPALDVFHYHGPTDASGYVGDDVLDIASMVVDFNTNRLLIDVTLFHDQHHFDEAGAYLIATTSQNAPDAEATGHFEYVAYAHDSFDGQVQPVPKNYNDPAPASSCSVAAANGVHATRPSARTVEVSVPTECLGGAQSVQVQAAFLHTHADTPDFNYERDDTAWSTRAAVTWVAPPPNSVPAVNKGIHVTKVRYNAPGKDTRKNLNGEYVRITNTGRTAVSLTHFRLSDNSGHAYAFPTTTLKPHASLDVYSGNGKDTPEARHWRRSRHMWNNTGLESATLRDDRNRVMSTHVWHAEPVGFKIWP
jgi:hypothetical protein